MKYMLYAIHGPACMDTYTHTYTNMQQDTLFLIGETHTHTEGKRLTVSNPISGLMVLSYQTTIL